MFHFDVDMTFVTIDFAPHGETAFTACPSGCLAGFNGTRTPFLELVFRVAFVRAVGTKFRRDL
jgi:hypothetical protein